jgi:hypothetical protein
MAAMRVRVVAADLALNECITRIPFRFGISTLTRAPQCTARVRIETTDGATAEGFSADLLVPKWFEKNPDRSTDEDIAALTDSARCAAAAVLACADTPATVFDLWWRVYRDRVTPTSGAPDTLVRGFGVALLERALMDAACRVAGTSFTRAVHDDLFGFRPAAVRSDLEGWSPAQSLPATAARTVDVRHTVGLLDALTRDAVAERVDDGLPESLEEDVRRYGLSLFKIKLCGRLDEDLDRLHAIADVLERTGVTRPRLTIDGNEQFEDLALLVELFERLAGTDRGARLMDGLLYVEQPLDRRRTFDTAPNEAMPRLREYAPVIIDEADFDVPAFTRAVALGYGGVSIKNCKGVFRALVNRGVCDRADGTLFQSAEDLTTLPVLALQQDLVTVATLGLTHVERNGHHYFRGLDHLPPEEASAALAAHPDLYERDDHGIELRIRDGRLALDSLHDAGFGHRVPIAWDRRTPVPPWPASERVP